MKSIAYHEPELLAETFALLQLHGEDAVLLAGGTALLVLDAVLQVQGPDGQGETALDGFLTAPATVDLGAQVLHLDREPAVIFPDPICMLDPGSGRGLMSLELRVGMAIDVLAAPAQARLRAAAQTEAGKKAFSPFRFGQPSLTFEPLENLWAE